MTAQYDIVDPSDFCRACGGKGGHDEQTERGTNLFEPCYLCRGTGSRTVRVDPVSATAGASHA